MSDEVRMFIVGADGTTSEVRASEGLSRAYDVLHAAGLANEKRLSLCHAAERQGRDPVAFAHHLVTLASTLDDRDPPFGRTK